MGHQPLNTIKKQFPTGTVKSQFLVFFEEQYMKRVLFTSLALSLVGLAQATGLGVAGDFNAFVFNNVNIIGAESEGAVAVKGNFTTNQSFNMALNATAGNLPVNATNIGLYVGGNTNFVGGQLHGGKVLNGNAFVGGSTVSNNIQVQNGSLNPSGSSVDLSVFTTAYSQLSTLSANLAGLQAVNFSLNDVNNPTVNLGANTLNGSLKVFNISASDLNQLGTLNAIGFTGNETVVFNVYGSNVAMNRNWQESGTSFGNLTERTLWNFVDATNITNNRQLNGTVLALDATFNQGELLEGGLIVNNWTQSGAREIHSNLFNGNLNPVPEPCTLSLLALLALRKRKRKQVAI